MVTVREVAWEGGMIIEVVEEAVAEKERAGLIE